MHQRWLIWRHYGEAGTTSGNADGHAASKYLNACSHQHSCSDGNPTAANRYTGATYSDSGSANAHAATTYRDARTADGDAHSYGDARPD